MDTAPSMDSAPVASGARPEAWTSRGRGLTLAEIEYLYRAHSGNLAGVVRRHVGGVSDATREDACQHAWMQLVVHRDRVARDAALSWLMRVAIRRGYRLARGEKREVPLLDAMTGTGGSGSSLDSRNSDGTTTAISRSGRVLAHRWRELTTSPPSVESLHARDCIAALPERERRMVLGVGLGLSYDELSELTGDSPRTVERLILRGRRRLRLHETAV